MTGTGRRRKAQHASWKVLVPRHGRGAKALAMPAGVFSAEPKSRPAVKLWSSPARMTARIVRSRRVLCEVETRTSITVRVWTVNLTYQHNVNEAKQSFN